jgi:hypothetical protein
VRPTSSINPFTLVFLFTSLLHVEEEDEDEDEDEDVFVFVFVLTRRLENREILNVQRTQVLARE